MKGLLSISIIINIFFQDCVLKNLFHNPDCLTACNLIFLFLRQSPLETGNEYLSPVDPVAISKLTAQNPFNPAQLLLLKSKIFHRADIVEHLFWAAGAYQNGGNPLVFEQPGDGHLSQCLATGKGNIVELAYFFEGFG